MSKLARYRKFVIALLAAAGVVGAELPPSAPSWLSSAFAIAGAIGVWAVRNDPPPHPSAATSFVTPAPRQRGPRE